MNEQLIPALEEVGLSRNEAIVYLSLLDIGESTATKIADVSKLHRTNVYDSLERLMLKGFVSHITKDKTKLFTAANPASLFENLRKKEEDFKAILPQLKAAKDLIPSKDSAVVYEGVAGIKAITEDILDSVPKGGTVVTFGVPKNTPDLMSSFLASYHRRRIQKKITMLHLYNENASERIAYLNSMPYTEARYLPKEYDSPAAVTTIYGSKVAFFIWAKEPVGILIDSSRMAESYMKYFELLWKMSNKYLRPKGRSISKNCPDAAIHPLH